MARIIFSAAHTLQAPGEIYQDLREADLTRKILKLAIPYLEKSGVESKTVPLDLHLLDRIEWINNTGYTASQGDIFIEIHVNDGNKRGIEGWFNDNPGPENLSQTLAEFMLEEVCGITKYQNQTAKSEYEHDLQQLLILRQTNPIAVALECLYIDNEDDIKILKDEKKLDELAKSLADAAVKFAKLPKEEIDKRKAKQVAKDLSKDLNLGGFGGGMSGGFPPSPAGIGSTTPTTTTPAASGSSNLVMDREQRRKMIIKVYKKALGKEPNQNDINLFLNQGLSEEQLLKKIFDMDEHKKMVDDAKEAKELKEKVKQLEAEVEKLNTNSKDRDIMLNQLNQLLQQKNYSIERMKQEMIARGVMKPGEFIDFSGPPTLSR